MLTAECSAECGRWNSINIYGGDNRNIVVVWLEEPRLTFGPGACFSTSCWSTLRTVGVLVQMLTHFPADKNPPQPPSHPQAVDPSQGPNIQIIVDFQTLPGLLCVLVLASFSFRLEAKQLPGIPAGMQTFSHASPREQTRRPAC